MDGFIEQLVARKPTMLDHYKRSGLILAAVLVCFLSVGILPQLPGILGQAFSLLGLVLAAASVFAVYYFIASFSLEYEYSLTGSDLDIDKIVGKRRRRRLLSVNGDSTTEIGRYSSYRQKGASAQKISLILACAAVDDPDTYYLLFHDQKYGHGILLFSPNERLIKELRRQIKPSLWKD